MKIIVDVPEHDIVLKFPSGEVMTIQACPVIKQKIVSYAELMVRLGYTWIYPYGWAKK